MCTRARHFSYSEPDSSNPRLLSPPLFYVENLFQYYFSIFPFVFQVICCLQVYWPIPCMHLLSPHPKRTTCSAHLFFYVDYPNNILRQLQIMGSPLFIFLQPPVAQIEAHNLKFSVCFPNYIRHIFTKLTNSWSRDAILLISLEVTGMQTQWHILTDYEKNNDLL